MAISIAAHAVVLTALALHAPRLVIPHEEAGPPEPIIPILIMPRTPPSPPGSTQPPQPIRLHRRHLPHEEAPPASVPLFVAPKEAPTPPPPKPRPQAAPRITVQPSPGAQLSTALRGGIVGCANPELLSPGERERCIERLGRGVGQGPEFGPTISAAKRADFDRAAQAKQRDREPGMPTGVAAPYAESGAGYRNKPDQPDPLPGLRP